MEPAVIGEGSYGCVHRPSLHCNKTPKKFTYEGKISKIGKKKYINQEIKEYKTIDKVDKTAKFYPGKPKGCLPENDFTTLAAIDQCENYDAKDITKYKLLVMRDGGKNLEDFVKSEPTAEKMKKFWIEVHRLFLGLVKFLEAGVVHHDLKHLNIVYDSDNNRINFIDFGLMTTIDEIKTESNDSEYGFAKWHWSFPPEIIFYNKDEYTTIASGTKSTKKNEYSKFIKEIKNPKSSINYFIEITNPKKTHDKSNKKQKMPPEFLKHLEEYNNMLEFVKPDTYNIFLDKSIETIDSYGLAHSLIYVLNETRDKIDSKMADDLYYLFYNMLNFNVFERVTITDALSRYEDILENSGLLKKYKKYFELHNLKERIDTPIPKNITIPKIKISRQLLDVDPTISCPQNTQTNKHTKKCKSLSVSKKTRTRRKTLRKTA